MVVLVIFEITMLLMLLALIYTFGQASMYNGNYVMGITLAKPYRSEPEVKQIVGEYLKKIKKIHLIGLITGLVPILLTDYTSLMLMYLFIWFFILIYLYEGIMKKHAWRLYDLKKEKGWMSGSTGVKRVDTVVSSMNKKLPVSPVWLVPVGIIGVYNIYAYVMRLVNVQNNETLSKVSIAYTICTFMFIGIYFAVANSSNKVYCKDSRINLKVNRSIKYEWTRYFVVTAYGAAIMGIVVGNIKAVRESLPQQLLAFSIIFFVPIILMLVTYQNVQKVKRFAFDSDSGEKELPYDDDDIYFLTDKVNPNAGRLQEKRVGIGFTLNMGKPAEYVIIFIVMAFVAGMSLFMLKFDLADITLTVREEGRSVNVSAADMGYTFEVADIEAVMLLDKCPSMSKSHGYDGSNFYFGTFRVSGYEENCEVYLSLKNPQVIVVETKDKTILFNDKSTEETFEMYELLLELTGE